MTKELICGIDEYGTQTIYNILDGFNKFTDKNSTIQELIDHCNEKLMDAKARDEKKLADFKKILDKKVFKIVYNAEHIIWMRVDKYEIWLRSGEIWSRLDGELIKYHKGTTTTQHICDLNDEPFKRYFGTNSPEHSRITLAQYNKVKKKIDKFKEDLLK